MNSSAARNIILIFSAIKVEIHNVTLYWMPELSPGIMKSIVMEKRDKELQTTGWR